MLLLNHFNDFVHQELFQNNLLVKNIDKLGRLHEVFIKARDSLNMSKEHIETLKLKSENFERNSRLTIDLLDKEFQCSEEKIKTHYDELMKKIESQKIELLTKLDVRYNDLKEELSKRIEAGEGSVGILSEASASLSNLLNSDAIGMIQEHESVAREMESLHNTHNEKLIDEQKHLTRIADNIQSELLVNFDCTDSSICLGSLGPSQLPTKPTKEIEAPDSPENDNIDDPKVTDVVQDEPKISVSRQEKHFQFQELMDKNGLFFWYGTVHNKHEYMNPALDGRVQLEASSR